jgi:hypothetical protein
MFLAGKVPVEKHLANFRQGLGEQSVKLPKTNRMKPLSKATKKIRLFLEIR